jgi:N-acyl-D-aspartate/D-glutamate deacylase
MESVNPGKRQKLVIAATALLLLSFGVGAKKNSPAVTETYDVVIANGRAMDPESGLDAVSNVGIRGGKIAAISTGPLKGKQPIEARGLVVGPGFIDLHQHGQDAENYAAKAADGVTTALELEVGVADLDPWYGEREGKALINYGASVGHIPVRMAVMHDPGTFLPSGDAAHRVATTAEVKAISALLEKGLKRGALAVGLGPAYTEAATNQEIREVFRVAANYRASCHVHIRGSGSPMEGNFSGFEEVIADARARGMDVTTESYPYTMGMTSIQAAMFDHKEEEAETYFASLLWPATGEHLTKESFPRYRKQGGMVILPSNTQENVHAAVAIPLTMIASDGYLAKGQGHPRTAGTFALVLGRYVREEQALDLMMALKKMTLMPAQRLEKRAPMFKEKGRIRVGADADITVFDPWLVIDRAT